MIRPFQPEDLDAVVRLWLDANSQAHSFIPRSYWEEQREAVRAALPRAEVYVHQNQAGQIDGFIGLVGQWIEGIFVSQDARSQGVGRLLLDCAKEHKPALRLHAYQKNPRALDFTAGKGLRSRDRASIPPPARKNTPWAGRPPPTKKRRPKAAHKRDPLQAG